VAPALIGRDHELGVLAALLDRAAAGQGDAVAVVGAAGMGKSGLLATTAEAAVDRGFTVVTAGLDELEQHVPLSAAGRLAAALGADLDGGPEGIAHRALDATSENPVVRLLDDLQWLDAASVPFIVALIHAATEGPLALVMAARPPAPTSHSLARVLGAVERRGAQVLHLGSLPDGPVTALAEAVLGTALEDEHRALLGAAAGNPFLVLEVARALRSGRRPGTESILMHTLHHVSADARVLLEHASVLGREAAVADIAHMAERSPAELAGAVREAVASGLVDGSGPLLSFRHDLIREAVYATLPTAVRGAIHRRAAEALTARDAPPLTVATHLVEGALPGDLTAIRSLQLASTEAATADLSVALSLLESARRLCDDDSDIAASIDRRLVVLLAWTGRSPEAIDVSNRLLRRTADPAEEARLRAGLAEALARGGDEAAGAREAEKVLAVPDVSPAIRARLLVLRATGLWETHPAQCRVALDEARREGDKDPVLEIAIVQHEAASLSAEVDIQGYLEAAARGVALARNAVAEGRPLAEAHLTWALANLAEAEIAAERPAEALRVLGEWEHRARRAGLTSSGVPEAAGLRAEVHLLECRWDDARAELQAREELLLEAGRPDTTLSGVPARTSSGLARISVLTGAPEASIWLERWQAVADRTVERARHRWWAGFDALQRGDRLGAVTRYREGVRLTHELRDQTMCPQRAVGWQLSWVTPVLTLWSAGHRDEARMLSEIFLPVAKRNMWLPRWASWAESVTAVLEGDLAAVERAVASASSVATPLFRYQALADAAAAASEIGASEVAGRASEGASDLAEATGLVPPPDVVRRRRQRSVGRRPSVGWDSLTATEALVAGLVARGFSNSEIADELLISRYTVETHVKHIFQKVGVRSRVELATAVVRRGT
jgi:DNA-binding CsgD family transcriptional regulator